MPFTEQQNIGVNYKGDFLAIKSGAGTGKTTLLRGYALANPEIRMLYLCYNKAIQEEAKNKFPGNVVCRTLHAIAYAFHGKRLAHKLTENLRLTDIKNFLNTPSWEITKDANNAFNNFLSSSSKEIGPEHAPFLPYSTKIQKDKVNFIIKCASKIWKAAIDVDNKFPATHDVYLKLYCLEEPNMHKWFGAMLFDEAQDANPVVSDFVYKQQCKQIVVGDDHQQLYRWRGADNSIDGFIKKKNADVLIINKSFRFGSKTALLATRLLDYKSKIAGCPPFPIEGNETIQDEIHEALPPSILQGKHTRLHRSVAGTIKTGLENISKRIYWIGGLEKYNIQEILDIYHLYSNQKKNIKRKKIIYDYKTYKDYKLAATSTGDPEMRRIVKIIDEHKDSIPSKVSALRKNEVKDEKHAVMCIGTCHRSKGLEWPVVVIENDFRDLLDPESGMDEDTIADELNLLYVACTRAMKYLQPTQRFCNKKS